MTVLESDTRAPEPLLAAGLGGALALAALVPYKVVAEGPVWCPLLRLTGVQCPTCGMTRSWSLLAHGDVVAATAMHPIGPLAFVLALVSLVAILWRWRAGRWAVAPQHLVRALVVLAAAAGVFGAARWAGLVG